MICSVIAFGGYVDFHDDVFVDDPSCVAARLADDLEDAALWAYVVLEHVELETPGRPRREVAGEAQALLLTGLTRRDLARAARQRERRYAPTKDRCPSRGML